MTAQLLKEKLHDYIEHADEGMLQVMYDMTGNGYQSSGYTYDEETLKMLEERDAAYERGEEKGLTVEQANEFVKSEIKKRSA